MRDALSLFNKRVTLLDRQDFTIGEFDITVDGAYRNISTFPMKVRKGKDVFVHVTSDNGVDVSIVDVNGMNVKYSAAVKEETMGPVHVRESGTMALVFGVYRGDLAHVTVEAWME